MNKIQESNKLIAKFMGGKFYVNAVLQPNYSKNDCFVGIENIPISECQKRHYYIDSLLAPHTTELKYHKSWDWLMPVVEKIVKVKKVKVGGYRQSFILSNIFHSLMEVNIDKVYKYTVEFIKQYND